MIKECGTFNEFFEILQRSYEGCNYVNKIVIEGEGGIGVDFPRLTFETPEGFVNDQRTRRGTITLEYVNGHTSELSRTATILAFLGEFYRNYDYCGHVVLNPLSAKLYMGGVPNEQGPLELRLEAE